MQAPAFTPMRKTSVRRTERTRLGGQSTSERSSVDSVRHARKTRRMATGMQSVLDAVRMLEDDSESEQSLLDEDDFMLTGVQTSQDPRHRAFFSNSMYFKSIVGVMIMANTVVIALEALYIQHQFVFFDQLELFFTIFYVIEISWRIWERGIISFLSTDDWWWAWFDLLITSLSLVDTFLDTVTGQSSGASVGRLFRVFRILRMFRAMKFMNEVDYVLAHAAKATFKLAIVVTLVLFVAAIIATNMLWDCPDPVVSGMFSDLHQSLWAMFKLMTLDDWVPVSERVIKVRPGMVIFFVVFIFSTSIALISLVPAIFIEISMNSREREDRLEEERQRITLRRQKTRLLRTLFKLTDRNNNGRISVEEMKTVLTNDSYLRQLQDAGLTEAGDLQDVRLGLFDLWEATLEETARTDSEITEEDFISGLLRTREDVSQSSLWRCSTATRLMLRDFSTYVRKELREIRYNTGHLEKEMKEIINSTKTEIINLKAVLADAASACTTSGEPGKLLRSGSSSTDIARRARSFSAAPAPTLNHSHSIMGGAAGAFSQDSNAFSLKKTLGSADAGQPLLPGQLSGQTIASTTETVSATTRSEGQAEQSSATTGSGNSQTTAIGLSPRQMYQAGAGSGSFVLPRVTERDDESSSSAQDQASGSDGRVRFSADISPPTATSPAGHSDQQQDMLGLPERFGL